MRVIVTAAGTSEPIDDVRVVTNLSTGRFGAAIARAWARAGADVTLLAGRALASHPEWVPPEVRVVRFGSFAELDAALTAALTTPADAVFMAAAVSDYSPVRVDGKIRSDADTMTITLRRNPKLLAGLRARCGVGAFLVGFKLLSGVSDEVLVATARAQVHKDRLNLCVANDLQHLDGPNHPVVLVTPEGGVLRRDGDKDTVANELVAFVRRRMAVTWHRSRQAGGSAPRDAGRDGAAALLGAAIDGGLLPGRDGNVSHRGHAGTSALWTTPRGVDKARLSAEDLVWADVDPAAREVAWRGDRKPSIDAAVHARLYAAMPQIAGMVHFHDGIVAPTASTGFPYPCGTVEEADEIVYALARAAGSGAWRGDGFAVALVDHGYLVGVTDAAAFAADWHRARAVHLGHLEALGADPAAVTCAPLIDGGRIAGVAARVDAGGWLEAPADAWSTFVLPELRNAGRGDRFAEVLADQRRYVVVGDACRVVDWYGERGFRPIRRDGAFALLEPPTRRGDLRPAASVCLVDVVGRSVLIGRRKTAPWHGHWAFPGGAVEPGESTLDAALRELAEETGIAVRGARPLRERTVYVGVDPAFAVTNFVIPVLTAQPPRATAELDAEWVPLDAVAALRPMGAGTRRVLRGLAAAAP